MAQLQNLPITIVASVTPGSVNVDSNYVNTSSIYNGRPYTWTVTLNIITTSNSDNLITPDPYQFNAYNIYPGMWLGQTNGFSYEIISVSTPVSINTVNVVLKDVGLYNLL